MSNNGAMSIAEGRYEYKVDVSLILNNGKRKKDFILRTCLDSYSLWKAKYAKSGSPFQTFIKGTLKEAAIIDNEVWVFGVDATKANDIVIAVKTAMNYFRVSAESIIQDIYVKNLNSEGEDSILKQALVDANKNLYSNVCKAIRAAAAELGCSNSLNFWVFSNHTNIKIPKGSLHDALRQGGAESVASDAEENLHRFYVGSNSGGRGPKFKTSLHLAVLKV
ncbi:hypothetical protein [Hahella sp. HN01]|uniref:hypothetical protein n=1 Tax=Hahella sp. HN01 TaxID=2847262 RepID=UPI001C1EE4AC|nr:hypothetical protein [Hahella sp. HN01]MBU6954616.1 hypothetical protein [Hahella sp. HN01]